MRGVKRFFHWLHHAPALPDAESQRIARLLHTLLLVLFWATVGGTVALLPLEWDEWYINVPFGLVTSAGWVYLRWLMQKGRLRLVSGVLTGFLALIFVALVWLAPDQADANLNAVGFCVLVTLSGLLFDQRAAMHTALASTGLVAGLTYLKGEFVFQNVLALGIPLALNALLLRYALNSIQAGLQRALAGEAAATAANQAKSSFLATMSHELRTPLNGILGYAQLLAQGELTPTQATGLRVIRKSGEHLLTLITDVLDMAKIEVGKITLQPTPVAFPEFLADLTAIVGVRAREKGLTFASECPTAVPPAILADEKRLRQVLLNLLSNAVKFTDSGTVTLRVLGQAVGLAAYQLTFVVTDTGPGIPDAQLPRLFRAFERAGDAQFQQQHEGTGLGLALSQQLVKLMGGRIEVVSQVGRGSRFWFTVTLPVAAAPVASGTATRWPVGYQGALRTLLVADDKDDNRQFLVDALTPLGFQVAAAVDGVDCVAQARAVRPDLILMDLVMPGLTGFEATQTLRADPELHAVCIIATTASVFDADQQQSQLAGCDGFLAKPIDLQALLGLLADKLGLTWEYAPVRPVDLPAILTAPPAAEQAVLRDLVAAGDVVAARERLAAWPAGDYAAWVAEFERRAAEFDEAGLLALIEEE